MTLPNLDISRLTPGERLDLLEQIWDSLSPEEVPLTEDQRAELDRRLDELERNGARGIPWEEIESRLRKAD